MEDAYKALGAGADRIYITNHGGREIDGSPATIDVLPDIAKAVNHRVPIIFDSGVRLSMKPYPVTSENQPQEDLDATSGASHH